MKRRVEICDGREAVADFVQGGGQFDPPPCTTAPPVKIGLNSTFPDTELHCFLPDKPTLDKYKVRTLKGSSRDISEMA